MSDDKKAKGIEEGPPIYMESLLNSIEYMTMSKKYRNTYNRGFTRPLSDFKPNEFKCRYRMGAYLHLDEIRIINQRIDQLRELLKSE